MLCKFTHCVRHVLANTRPYQLGWPGNRDCYLMHKMQSGGWSYVSKRLVEDIFSSCSYPLCSCLSFEDHMHAHIYRHSTPYLGYFETLNIVPLSEMHESRTVVSASPTQTLTLTARVWLGETALHQFNNGLSVYTLTYTLEYKTSTGN